MTGKFYARCAASDAASVAREQFAERRVRALFAAGPTDKYPSPLTTQHEWVYARI